MVHHLDGHHLDIADAEGLMGPGHMQVETRHTWIEMLGEAVGHGGFQSVDGSLVGIDMDVAEDAERPQVVDAADVVVVDMGEQDAVETLEWQGEYLLAEIGSAVDEHPRGVGLEQG